MSFLDYEEVDKEFLSKVKEIRSHFDYHFITSHIFIWHHRLDQNVYKSLNSTECMRVANIMIQRYPDEKGDHLITLSNNSVLNTEGDIVDKYEFIIDHLKNYL